MSQTKTERKPNGKNPIALAAFEKKNMAVYRLIKDQSIADSLQALTDLIVDQAHAGDWSGIVSRDRTNDYTNQRQHEPWGTLDFWIQASTKVEPNTESAMATRALGLLEQLVDAPAHHNKEKERNITMMEVTDHAMDLIKKTSEADQWQKFCRLAEKAPEASHKTLEKFTRFLTPRESMWFIENLDPANLKGLGSVSSFIPRLVRHFWRSLTLNERCYPREHTTWMRILRPVILFDEVFRFTGTPLMPPSQEEVGAAAITLVKKMARFATSLNKLVVWLKKHTLFEPKGFEYDLPGCTVTKIIMNAKTGRAGVYGRPLGEQRRVIASDIEQFISQLQEQFKELGLSNGAAIEIDTDYHRPEDPPPDKKVYEETFVTRL